MWIAVGVLYPITCLETCNVHSNTKGSFVRHPVASSVGAPGCSAAAIQMGKVSIGAVSLFVWDWVPDMGSCGILWDLQGVPGVSIMIT